MTLERMIPAAQSVERTALQVLAQRGLDPALVDRALLVESSGQVWLALVLDDKRAAPERYLSAQALHHLSTALKKPVIPSNHTGLRYCILLSSPARLPANIPYPGYTPGLFLIGEDVRRRQVSMRWSELGHALVAGMTRFGKSSFLRLMLAQALEEGLNVILADPDGRSFVGLENAAGVQHYSSGRDGAPGAIHAAAAELDRRQVLYAQLAGAHDKLETYNQAAVRAGAETLPRLLIMVEEANGMVTDNGGPNGTLANTLSRLAWEGLKFGIHLVASGQTFEKAVVGRFIDQIDTRIVFHVASAVVSRVVLQRNGAEMLRVKGRALTNKWGIVQTYYIDLESIPVTIRQQDAGPRLTVRDRLIIDQLITISGGVASYEALKRCGIERAAAESLRADWLRRGILRPAENNSLRVNDQVAGYGSKPQPSQTVQTVQTGDKPGANRVQTDSKPLQAGDKPLQTGFSVSIETPAPAPAQC